MINCSESARIAGVFDNWLHDEVRSSHTEVNSYLDEYDTAIKGLKGGWANPQNFTARKHESHVHIRLPQAWKTYNMTLQPDTPHNQREYQSAWLMFTPLMQISGTYRNQCYMEATDAEDYLRRRMSRPSALDMRKTVDDRLRIWLPEENNFKEAKINLEDLGRELQVASELGTRAVKRVCARAAIGYDFGQEGSRSAHEMIEAQHAWASFATDCVVFAAKLRGGKLETVPFLEPKSISATPPPEVIYPLAA